MTEFDVTLEELPDGRYKAVALDGAIVQVATEVDSLRASVPKQIAALVGTNLDDVGMLMRFAYRPVTIDHAWDVLYRDFPEVYDRFSSFSYEPDPVELVANEFGLRDLDVLDIGSGTGRSTFKLARIARHVWGVEPEQSMRRVAEAEAAQRGFSNVSFMKGTRECIPLPNESVDAALSSTAGLDLSEARRVTRAGGWIVSIDIAPDAYGGHLNHILGVRVPELDLHSRRLVEQGMSYRDVKSTQRYPSVADLVATYGFIFGRRAIDYVRKRRLTHIVWTFRLHYLRP